MAVKDGAQDCPYTYMQDLAGGRYRLPWEDSIKITDGTSCGFQTPTRRYSPSPRRGGRNRTDSCRSSIWSDGLDACTCHVALDLAHLVLEDLEAMRLDPGEFGSDRTVDRADAAP